MNHKIEIDEDFILPDEPEVIQQHNEIFVMSLIFCIPIIGWTLLWFVIIGEWSWNKIRIARLAFLILWHKILNFKY